MSKAKQAAKWLLAEAAEGRHHIQQVAADKFGLKGQGNISTALKKLGAEQALAVVAVTSGDFQVTTEAGGEPISIKAEQSEQANSTGECYE